MSKVSPNLAVKRTMTGQVKYVDAFPSRGRRLLPNDNYGRILQRRITCLQSWRAMTDGIGGSIERYDVQCIKKWHPHVLHRRRGWRGVRLI